MPRSDSELFGEDSKSLLKCDPPTPLVDSEPVVRLTPFLEVWKRLLALDDSIPLFNTRSVLIEAGRIIVVRVSVGE